MVGTIGNPGTDNNVLVLVSTFIREPLIVNRRAMKLYTHTHARAYIKTNSEEFRVALDLQPLNSH